MEMMVSYFFWGRSFGRPAPNNLQSNRRVSAVARWKRRKYAPMLSLAEQYQHPWKTDAIVGSFWLPVCLGCKA